MGLHRVMLADLQCSPAGQAEELERGSLLQIDCAAPGPAPPTDGPVDAQAPPPPAAPPRPPADPACVHHVDLSFSKLTAVPPLAHYANLRALQLNNNAITTLQGLGGLVSSAVRCRRAGWLCRVPAMGCTRPCCWRWPVLHPLCPPPLAVLPPRASRHPLGASTSRSTALHGWTKACWQGCLASRTFPSTPTAWPP